MLKPRQKKCIEMLVSGAMTQADVAAALKVSEQTICNWKKNEEFAAELAAANRLVISSLVPAAVQRTKALLSADSEAVQLAAAKDILDRAGYKPQDNIRLHANIVSEKLADVFKQIGGEGLDE